MGLFNFFKKTNTSKLDNNISDEQRFEVEFLATIPRYLSIPKAQVEYEIRSEQSNRLLLMAEAFPEQFDAWKTAVTIAEKRRIIYAALDDKFLTQLELWQVMERFTKDCSPEKALLIASENSTINDMVSADYWASLANANFILTNYSQAEANSFKALEIDPTNKRGKIALADIYHINEKYNEAHEIYNKILEKELGFNKKKNLNISELVGFDADILNSPIYAYSWFTNDTQIDQDTWKIAYEEDFYYSPHFRFQYAHYLLRINEKKRCFLELLDLSDEMPWFKDGVLNAYNLIHQFRLEDQLEDDKARLQKLIQQNNWSDPKLQ